MGQEKRIKKIILDMIINVVASFIPVFLLQLLIHPMLAKHISQEQYGDMITTISVIMVISGSLGNVLNNVRLLLNDIYENEKKSGDFNIYLIWYIVLSVGLIGVTFFYLKIGNIIDIFIGILVLLQGYMSVTFRINLNFKKIFICNLFMSFGYIVGYFFSVYRCTRWQYIYIFGYVFSLCYTIHNSTLLKEPILKTERFYKTRKECRTLVGATVLANALNYSDRIIISPIIGSDGVTIYYISTLLGKMIAQLVGPISSVILGYLAKMTKIEKKKEKKLFAIIMFICSIGYVICVLIAPRILIILYPQYYIQTLELIPITTATAMFTAFSSIISPFVLKFCSRLWQIVINSITLISYVLGAIIGYYVGNMKGFCIGIAIAFMIKGIMLYYALRKKNEI